MSQISSLLMDRVQSIEEKMLLATLEDFNLGDLCPLGCWVDILLLLFLQLWLKCIF